MKDADNARTAQEKTDSQKAIALKATFEAGKLDVTLKKNSEAEKVKSDAEKATSDADRLEFEAWKTK